MKTRKETNLMGYVVLIGLKYRNPSPSFFLSSYILMSLDLAVILLVIILVTIFFYSSASFVRVEIVLMLKRFHLNIVCYFRRNYGSIKIR